MSERIVVLGIGNTILSDEGLGVRALEILKDGYSFQPQIELLDGGTIGIDLLYFVEGADKLLVLDAVSGGKLPGSVYVFEHDEVKKYFRNKVSMHDIGFQEVMALLELKGKELREIVVMGIEPKVIDIGAELSPEVESAMPDLIDKALSRLESWGVKVLLKEEV